MLDSDHQVQYEFDRFTVDPKQRLFFVTGESTPVDLPPRAFDALLYLIERPGQLLSKAELLHALWPDVIVEENSLNQVISLVRRVLGEKPTEHRFIVTAPGRGYRFVAAVRTRGQDDEAPGTQSDLSVAVLPFLEEPTPAGDGLGEAIAADLIRLLSARSRIRVAAQASSFTFKGRSCDVQDVARTLNVAKILRGQVAREGDHVLVSVRLIDGRSGHPVSTVSRKSHMRNLAELQAELAREVAWALDPECVAMLGNSAAADPEAYLQYLRALALAMRPEEESVIKAIHCLRDSVGRDPMFSRAKSQLAIQYTSCVIFGFPVPGALDLARHEVAGALALDDQNGETLCAAAVIDCLSGSWSRAEERFRSAQSLTADPLVSGLRCAYLSLSVGQLERAFQQATQTLRMAPTHPIGVHMLATLHTMRGQDEQSLLYANLATELGQSRTLAPMVDILSGLALRARRSTEAASHVAAALPARLRTAESLRIVQLLCLPGRTTAESGAVIAGLRRLEGLLSEAELDPPMRKRMLRWYVNVGAMDQAFELAFKSLDHYAREGTVGGAWGVLWLPEMTPFRNDPRFWLFAHRIRLFEYWSEYGPPDGYALHGDRLSVAN